MFAIFLGMACRRKVQRHLMNQFRWLEEAEDFYRIDYFEGQQEESSAAAAKATSTPLNPPPNHCAICQEIYHPYFTVLLRRELYPRDFYW